MNAVRAIIWKETRSFLRKKLYLGVVVLIPLFLGVSLSLRSLVGIDYHSHLGNYSYRAIGFGLYSIRKSLHHPLCHDIRDGKYYQPNSN